MKNTSLTAYLEKLTDYRNFSISKVVASEALQYDNPHLFFKDLAKNGCVCGMIGCLVYYADTSTILDQHYAEIESLREESDLTILKNDLVWFAFEAVAYQVYREWEQGD